MKPIVLVVTHKPEVMIETPVAVPITVNHSIQIPGHWLRDNSGLNISIKNPNYCELTAMYWAWKNLPKEYTHVGLFHYRRGVVTNQSVTKKFKHSIKVKGTNRFNDYYSDKELLALLEKYEVILPKQAKLEMSLEKHYKCKHVPEDWSLLIDTICELFPSDCELIQYYFSRETKISWANMFVAKREIFDEYCDWLFRIMFELEKKIHISQYAYQARVFGFISERLMNLFFYRLNSYHIKQLPYLDLS